MGWEKSWVGSFDRPAEMTVENLPVSWRAGSSLGGCASEGDNRYGKTLLPDRRMHHGRLLKFEGRRWHLKEAAARVAKRTSSN